MAKNGARSAVVGGRSGGPLARTIDNIDVYCAHTRLAKVADLKPNPRNPYKHPRSQRERLGAVIRAQGWRNAIVVSRRSGFIVKGHGRLETAIDEGWTEVPIDEQYYASEAAEYADLIADNRLAELADRDDSALTNLLADLNRTADFDATLTGYNDAELQRMLRSLNGNGAGSEDDVDLTPPAKPKSKAGEVYTLGTHVLLCADATTPNVWAQLLLGAAEVLWTDPPYGVSIGQKNAGLNRQLGGKRLEVPLENDTPKNLQAFLTAAFRAADAALISGGRFYLAAPPGPRETDFRLAISEVGWTIHQGLVWLKDSMVLGHSDYHYKHEPMLYGWKAGVGRVGRGAHKGTRWYGDHSQVSVFEIPRPKRSEEHPTMKPVALVEACLLNSSKENDLVIDPFGGSGTTLVACERLKRCCAMIELDPRYVDVIRRRYAELVNDPSLAP